MRKREGWREGVVFRKHDRRKVTEDREMQRLELMLQYIIQDGQMGSINLSARQ